MIACLLIFPSLVWSKGVYQKPSDFLVEIFNNQVPKPSVLWITGELRQQVADILQHKPPALRVRYWRKNMCSVWILEEIGKEKAITVGIVVDQGKIERVKTLIFRESRGWEIRESFFTHQFNGRSLTRDHRLDESIDSITGATLSVRAVTKLARIALLLHDQVTN